MAYDIARFTACSHGFIRIMEICTTPTNVLTHRARDFKLGSNTSSASSRFVLASESDRFLVSMNLSRLATILSPPFLSFVLCHARPELDVDPRRRGKAKRFCHFDKVEFVHVEDGAEGVRGIRLEVRAIGIFRRLKCDISVMPRLYPSSMGN